MDGKKTYISATLLAIAGIINAVISALVQAGKLSQDTAQNIFTILNSLYALLGAGAVASLRHAIAKTGDSSNDGGTSK